MRRNVTATVAAKHFRQVLDAVEHHGDTFQVERHGRLVATIGPAEGGARRRVSWAEARAALLAGPQADDDFASDLAEVRVQVGVLPLDPWERF
jgi:antitoxin (DNA-binding transcriptional repressor) of toxin-antitoxin stability system